MPTPLQILSQQKDQLTDCTKCKLHTHRTNIVFGEGSPTARVVFVGEGPGYHEDQTGRPFVGPAGQLLDKMIQAMGMKREDVFITNVVKCRPPNNRTPEADEVEACAGNVFREIEAIKPQVVVLLGMSAAKAVLKLKHKTTMSELHGGWLASLPQETGQHNVIVTYHPAALLRNEDLKLPTWNDLQLVMKRLELHNESEKKAASEGKETST